MKQIKPTLEEMVRLREEVSALLTRRAAAVSPPEASSETSEEAGVDAIDGSLPMSWNADLDILMISGSDRHRLAACFRERGFGRVWTLSAEEISEGDTTDLTPDQASAKARGIISAPPEQWLFVTAGVAEDNFDPQPFNWSLRAVFVAAALGRNTKRRFGRMWAQQLVRNLPHLSRAPTLSEVDLDFQGKPCLIVCPGPSLKRNIHQLAEAKGKAVIIAVNHAAHAVFGAGVVPDLIIAVDPTELILPHFSGLDLSEVSGFIFSTAVDPRLFELPGIRRMMTVSINGTADAFVADLGVPLSVLPCGGSVAHAAFSTARHWQCSPIAVMGQDLAYTGGENYLSGTVGHVATVDTTGEQVVEVKGQNGDTLVAPLGFDAFRLWFEMAAEISHDVDLVNCTEGGAHIEGFRNEPLARFIASCSDQQVDVEAHLSERWEASDEAQQANVLQQIRERLSRLRFARKASDECINAVKARAAGRMTENKLRRVEKQMRSRVRGLPEITLFLQKELGETLEATEVGQQADRALAQTAVLYNNIDEALSVMLSDYRAISDAW